VSGGGDFVGGRENPLVATRDGRKRMGKGASPAGRSAQEKHALARLRPSGDQRGRVAFEFNVHSNLHDVVEGSMRGGQWSCGVKQRTLVMPLETGGEARLDGTLRRVKIR